MKPDIEAVIREMRASAERNRGLMRRPIFQGIPTWQQPDWHEANAERDH